MNRKLIFGSGLAALLIAGAPFMALAHEDGTAKAQFNLGSFISAHVGAHVDNDNDNDQDHDGDAHKGHMATSTPFANVAAGTVTAVNGSTFTIAGLFGHGTTTVTTDANTVFKAKGGATTSVAINVGSRVFVVGTTTATSTAGNTMAASLVTIIGNGLAHLRFWLWFHNK